ncbi:hypothetical protein ABE26_09720 [Cytobacillus firmus]|nr:hypothetical protein [Cytobacillus firmus]
MFGTTGQVASLYNVKARNEEQRLKTPLPPKSCIWSCDAHADEAFLVLWASTNIQWEKAPTDCSFTIYSSFVVNFIFQQV